MQRKLRTAIIGTGNIGTDLLVKITRSEYLECVLCAGRNLNSPGMKKASGMNIPVSPNSIDAIIQSAGDIDLVFDATSAQDHYTNSKIFRELGLIAIDLTPSRVGKMCIPAVNMQDCLEEDNLNMVTCGGQASIPLAYAIASVNKEIEYIETISSIASRSAGPATRINLDEYLQTTEMGIKSFSNAERSKAILNLNPAVPCVDMQTTVLAKIANPDLVGTKEAILKMVAKLQTYIPGYELIVEPMIENGRLAVMVRVRGLGDYLPSFAGNLDIINCAAIAAAEAFAKKRAQA
ncbi:acetaldehyde dehydrogenase (acetylating) [Flavipsychrobacter stenotrophus]|uniref:Acetaldehyde dehydrogenase n=1 Tax=Flavipsychrobacter stenotrophus TaxID=2077091 RepID=A0A2S7SRD7_9BACT|nr:acetaldehyde dehydrogenase (acetylating) [Flavipsychrobacter stenotrophus]PQJ09473.1 acetaldehyde dehydrogenase (acetylating) [Flavipsychrobacter stenotrophus]